NGSGDSGGGFAPVYEEGGTAAATTFEDEGAEGEPPGGYVVERDPVEKLRGSVYRATHRMEKAQKFLAYSAAVDHDLAAQHARHPENGGLGERFVAWVDKQAEKIALWGDDPGLPQAIAAAQVHAAGQLVSSLVLNIGTGLGNLVGNLQTSGIHTTVG